MIRGSRPGLLGLSGSGRTCPERTGKAGADYPVCRRPARQAVPVKLERLAGRTCLTRAD